MTTVRHPYPAPAELTTDERLRLVELEVTIERGLESFIAVGRALTEIRDRRL